MIVAKTILYIILITVLVIVAILFLLLIIPFPYKLKLGCINDENFTINIKYLIFRLNFELRFKPKFFAKLTLCDKVLMDSSIKKEKKKSESIEKTDFIQNKDLSKELETGKKDIKKLFLSAKRVEKEKAIEIKKNNKRISHSQKKDLVYKSNNIIDKFKSLLPYDFIYVVKRIIAEGINVLERIKPSKCKVDIRYSDKDPYKMGMLMSFAAPFYAMIGDSLKVKSSDRETTMYEVLFKGNPVLISLIVPIIKLLADKRVRKVIFKKKVRV